MPIPWMRDSSTGEKIVNSQNRVSASLQLGWRVARLNVADDGVVRGRSNGDCLASKPMEEQTSYGRGSAPAVRRCSTRAPASDRRGPARTMTTRQYSRLVSRWIASTGLDASLFGTHSLRRTKATLIYRRTGNLRAVQLLLGHTKIESTVRYLGIEVDDALAIAEQVDV